MESFASYHVARFAKVSLRQLQWWDKQRLVSPDLVSHRRIYSSEDALLVAVIAELKRKRFTLQMIRPLVRSIETHLSRRAPAAHSFLMTDGKSIVIESDTSAIIERFKQSQRALVLVCISDLIERFDRMKKESSDRRFGNYILKNSEYTF